MINRHNASFKDSAGQVYQQDTAIYRTVAPSFATAFEAVRATGLIDQWISHGDLWPENRMDDLSSQALLFSLCVEKPYAILSHPPFPFISYPYEWPFALLKKAALFHLRLLIDALKKQISFKDSSAFNIQFDGVKPLFIDHLSFQPYQKGYFWEGHTQFFQEFLNPLLLQAYVQCPYHAFYRGTLEGISTSQLAKMLPFRYKYRPKTWLHIVLQARLDQNKGINKTRPAFSMPPQGLIRLWMQLSDWISQLEDKSSKTHWQAYTQTHSYRPSDYAAKKQFIHKYIQQTQPEMLWDLGCNTGAFSEIALEAGAKRVIGFDNDHSALHQACQRAEDRQLCFTPLYMDMKNPSPAQGWAHKERDALSDRQQPDAVLALALIHHLVISGHLPLSMVIPWLLSCSPSGIIEFIPEHDPMIQQMLAQHTQPLQDYNLPHCLALINQQATIRARLSLGENGRELIWFEKHA